MEPNTAEFRAFELWPQSAPVDDDGERLGQCYALARARAQEYWDEADRVYGQQVANAILAAEAETQ